MCQPHLWHTVPILGFQLLCNAWQKGFSVRLLVILVAQGWHMKWNVVPSVKTVIENFVFRMPSLAFQLPAAAAKGKWRVCVVGNVVGSTSVVVALSCLIASVDWAVYSFFLMAAHCTLCSWPKINCIGSLASSMQFLCDWWHIWLQMCGAPCKLSQPHYVFSHFYMLHCHIANLC